MSLAVDLKNSIKSATQTWKKAKRRADRQDRISSYQLSRMRMYSRVSIRDAAFHVMEDAYNKASSNGKYYANARQIMYAARPKILELTGESQLNDIYFTQKLLKDYIEEKRIDWKVVWDARGHLIEPFTGKSIGLGGIDVLKYIQKWKTDIDLDLPDIPVKIETKGPVNRFRNVLFIEKEGFTEVLKDAEIDKRFDMALMSTKGIPVKAACDIINEFEKKDARVFVLHDFDLDGFKIVRTLREGTRMAWGSDVIDLGLRIDDIQGLQSEPVYYKQSNPQGYLKVDCDATEEEIDFLVSGYRRGNRVEINAMTSERLITWLEKKFREHNVTKLIPDDDDVLKRAFDRAVFMQKLTRIVEEFNDDQVDEDSNRMPKDIKDQVNKLLKVNPEMSWDEAVWKIAEEVTEDKE